MIKIPNVLLVSGSGRNVGKTTLVCNIIERFSKSSEIIAIKITPHFHHSREQKDVILETDNLFIARELDRKSKKDSSLMIQSGANLVYYIEVKNEKFEAIVDFIQTFPAQMPIVCESASLGYHIEPGLFILLDNAHLSPKKQSFLDMQSKADRVFPAQQFNMQVFISQLEFKDGWIIYQT